MHLNLGSPPTRRQQEGSFGLSAPTSSASVTRTSMFCSRRKHTHTVIVLLNLYLPPSSLSQHVRDAGTVTNSAFDLGTDSDDSDEEETPSFGCVVSIPQSRACTFWHCSPGLHVLMFVSGLHPFSSRGVHTTAHTKTPNVGVVMFLIGPSHHLGSRWESTTTRLQTRTRPSLRFVECQTRDCPSLCLAHIVEPCLCPPTCCRVNSPVPRRIPMHETAETRVARLSRNVLESWCHLEYAIHFFSFFLFSSFSSSPRGCRLSTREVAVCRPLEIQL